jgi:hypothetical protein
MCLKFDAEFTVEFLRIPFRNRIQLRRIPNKIPESEWNSRIPLEFYSKCILRHKAPMHGKPDGPSPSGEVLDFGSDLHRLSPKMKLKNSQKGLFI